MEYRELCLDEKVLTQLTAFSEAWEAEEISYGYRRNEKEDIEGSRIFAALQDEKIIGYLMAREEIAKDRRSLMPDGTRCFEIEELYVTPEYRSQGVGRQLFSLAEQTAEREGYPFLTLYTDTKNYKAVLHFYIEEVGMEFWGAKLFKKLS